MATSTETKPGPWPYVAGGGIAAALLLGLVALGQAKLAASILIGCVLLFLIF